MMRIVKFSLVASGVVLALSAFVIGEIVLMNKRTYQETAAAFAELYDLSVRLKLQSSTPFQQGDGFRSMMESKAVFLTKVREHAEMKADLEESLKKSDLMLAELTKNDSAVQPNESKKSELNANEVYEPQPNETFQTQTWIAKIHSKRNVSDRFQKWLEKNKKEGTIALIVDKSYVQDNFLILHFKSGSIPSMKMPKRVLNIEQIKIPHHEKAFLELDVFRYQAKTEVLARKFAKLKKELLAEGPQILSRIENADKKKWLWLAAQKSKEFIDLANYSK